jgi:hypothetical protein
MTPQTQTEQTPAAKAGNPVTRTVFDLATFDEVQLSKPFTPPTAPQTVEEALAACGNDTAKLLEVIHAGLTAEARDRAYNTLDGFAIVVDGEVTETLYTGRAAEGDMKKKIDNAVLSMAKVYGYDKSLPIDKRNELKDQARSDMRKNPRVLASFGITETAAPETAVPSV